MPMVPSGPQLRIRPGRSAADRSYLGGEFAKSTVSFAPLANKRLKRTRCDRLFVELSGRAAQAPQR